MTDEEGIMSLLDSRGHNPTGRNGYKVTRQTRAEVWEQIEGNRAVVFTTVDRMEVRFMAGMIKSLEFTPGGE